MSDEKVLWGYDFDGDGKNAEDLRRKGWFCAPPGTPIQELLQAAHQLVIEERSEAWPRFEEAVKNVAAKKESVNK